MQSRATEKLQITQPKIKQVSLITALTECEQAIKKYQLDTLLNKAKNSFKSLTDDEQDLVWAGLIKLGEALTFCRDRGNYQLKASGIIDPAIKFANARNYFIHHHVYFNFLNMTSKLNEVMEKMPTIAFLQEKLGYLKNSGLNILSKEIKSGANDYPFDYARQVEVLIDEFNKLEEVLKISTLDLKNIPSLIEVKLDNRIRNILTILLDLTGEGSANTYNSTSCEEEKAKAKEINRKFIDSHEDFAEFFTNIRMFRNALSHLDKSLDPPYKNVSEMLEFAGDLQKISVLGYTEALKNAFLAQEIKEKEAFALEMLEAGQKLKPKLKNSELIEIKSEEISAQPLTGILGKKRGHEEDIGKDIQEPWPTDSPKPSVAKKAKIESEESRSEAESEYPFSLFSKYGSISEEEKSESEEVKPTNTNRLAPK